MIFTLSWIPLLSALALIFIPAKKEAWLRGLLLASTGLTLALVLYLAAAYDTASGGFQFVARIRWLPELGITYLGGVDGINLTLCLLHGLVAFAGALMACRTQKRLKDYAFFYLVLVGAIYGVFTSLDLFFLYLFYELTLIPLYPMIGIWGSKNKEYGAMKLTLFITGGAVLALFGLLLLYQELGMKTFDLIQISQTLQSVGSYHFLRPEFQKFLAPFILIGFGVMASLWPLHSWSPIGYAAAPTSVSMLHAGVLKKMGPYLILRVAVGLLPEGTMHWGSWLAVLAGIGILYAGYAAVKQTDLKFIVGFSSVSHMGYVLLGIAAMNVTSLSGTVLLMFSHGIMAACTFAIIGFIYEQTHARGVMDYGGLGKKTPFLAVCFVMASMASLGLPGFSNFISEVLVFIGAWSRYPVIVSLAVFGILVTAVYLLRAVQRVCYGEYNAKWDQLKDARTFAERLPFVLLLGALLGVGFWPRILLRFIEPAVGGLL